MKSLTSLPLDSASAELRDIEVQEEIKSVVRVISTWMTVPLFLLFWVSDWAFYPEYKWEFLGIRLLIIPICWAVGHYIQRAKTLPQTQTVALALGTSVGGLLNAMIAIIPDATTPYYAGLNLVAIGGLSFIPFNRKWFFYMCVGIFLPYYTITFLKVNGVEDMKGVLVNSFFMAGSIIVCYLIRHFNETLREKEFRSRLALKEEIGNRDKLIKEKTNEAIRLNNLSNQFSPQVVRAIKSGHVDLEKGVHRAHICAIFVDIVGSTERVVRLDQQKVDRVLARFMDTVVSTFLKFDLTIDKFQGDGILAFANDPIPHDDFVQRTCFAALEVRELLLDDREFYLMNWKKEMQIRMGISMGYANVGFYGNKKFFRSYTAIGAPLPFASRLTNLAEPNQILVDSDVAQILKQERFQVKTLGEKTIKGFEDDQNIVFELVQAPEDKINAFAGSLTCPHHTDTVLYLDTNDKGHFEMKCRHCDYVLDQYSLEILGQIPQMKASLS